MSAKQINSLYGLEQISTVDNSVERYEEGKRDVNYNVARDCSFNTTTRARTNSASGYIVERNASDPSKEPAFNDSQLTQNESTASNTFVGLNRRRKISLPTRLPTRPPQFLEGGGRIELAKREVDLDACMPVFTKEATGSNQKQSTTPLAKTEFNGWMFEAEAQGSDAVREGHSGRRRRVSLPVLKVDQTDPQDFPNNKSVPGNQNGYLSPTWSSSSTSIPPVKYGPLISKKSNTRQWTQNF